MHFISVGIMCKAISLQQTVNGNIWAVDYNTELNYHIELAHQQYRKTKQSLTFSYKHEAKNYALKFDSLPMQAENVTSREVTEVKRTLVAKVNQKQWKHYQSIICA